MIRFDSLPPEKSTIHLTDSVDEFLVRGSGADMNTTFRLAGIAIASQIKDNLVKPNGDEVQDLVDDVVAKHDLFNELGDIENLLVSFQRGVDDALCDISATHAERVAQRIQTNLEWSYTGASNE